MAPSLPKTIHFGSFPVNPQVFHTTPLSFALVNLKPLLPGHVLVSPLRPTPRLSDLSSAEVSDLFLTVQRVGRMVERVFGAHALNVAIQDGVAAGQSVPHVHAHVIPRRRGDMDARGGGDKVYEALEGEDGDIGAHLKQAQQTPAVERTSGRRTDDFPHVQDEDRKPRSMEEMHREAEWLRKEMEKEID